MDAADATGTAASKPEAPSHKAVTSFAPERAAMLPFKRDPFAARTVPYVVRVECSTGGRKNCLAGTGTVMQYRCGGGPDMYRSDNWWLVTSSHVVCASGSKTVESEGYAEFFYQSGATPIRVDLDMPTCTLLSPPVPAGSAPTPDELDVAIIRSVQVVALALHGKYLFRILLLSFCVLRWPP